LRAARVVGLTECYDKELDARETFWNRGLSRELLCRVRTMETTMRLIMAAAFLTAAFAASSAFAQGSYVHHSFCLKTGSAQECAYDTFEQCEAAKRGGADSCVPNSPPQNH
jgi:hypothetical protein